jgi:hypothetical protein
LIEKNIVRNYTELDKMDSTRTLLSEKIRKADPSIDIQGADRKILEIANQDFISYLHSKSSYRVDEDGFIHNSEKKLSKEDKMEIDSFLTVWTGTWLKKWQQRVNLLIGEQKNKVLKVADKKQDYPKLDCREEIIGLVVQSLINNAEICGTRLIAENIVDTETGKCSKNLKDEERVLVILNKSLFRVRETVQRLGPLISIKVDKCYYC